ncbi:hypothetical protein [Azohydromonas aeria]|uniref:hypothetical protein n=1 Tax=Azohydromonas aeria TaxID=2590212 RepID=UPI0012F8BF0D|nr:hypothetical protein [Azohydromonas aeria]
MDLACGILGTVLPRLFEGGLVTRGIRYRAVRLDNAQVVRSDTSVASSALSL